MADDWQAGDLALCVNNSDNIPLPAGYMTTGGRLLRVGAVYNVRSIVDCPYTNIPLLVLEEVASQNPTGGFNAIRFRKIRSLTDEEREEALLEMNPPVREPV
jgi:hypothetical protein